MVIWRTSAGYAGVDGGFGSESRNTDRSRVLEFADNLNMSFMKQDLSWCLMCQTPCKGMVLDIAPLNDVQ